jgi:hypothetical protein
MKNAQRLIFLLLPITIFICYPCSVNMQLFAVLLALSASALSSVAFKNPLKVC